MDKSDYYELQLALSRNSGSHAHTASKAEFYLGQLVGKPNAKFSNCTQEQFISSVRQALGSGKWNELSDLMARWF